jgi:hypothetical protein
VSPRCTSVPAAPAKVRELDRPTVAFHSPDRQPSIAAIAVASVAHGTHMGTDQAVENGFLMRAFARLG